MEVKFNQLALEEVIKLSVGDMGDTASAYAICFAGYKANCYVKQIPLDKTFEQIGDEVDIMLSTAEGNLELAGIIKQFTDSNAFQRFIPKEELRPVEKKRTKKKV